MEKPAKARVDIFTLLGGKSDEKDEGEDMGSADLALKAAFRAVKDDDFDGFKEAMNEWRKCSEESESSDSDDYELDD